jgi:DNA-binding transcriptional LysR family regulator
MDRLFLDRRLERFLVIYEQQSLRAAADVLGMTQPALTISLKTLEDELGFPLFDRTSKGMEPTLAAETIYRYGAALRQGGRLAMGEVRRLNGQPGGSLRIGAGVAWTTTMLPGVLRELHRRFPDLSIDLVSGVGDQLATRLINGELDVVLAAGSMDRLASPEFLQGHLTNTEMKVVADPDSRLGRQREIETAELVSVPWVGFYEDENIVQQSRHFLALRNLPPARFVMRSNSPAALYAFLRGTEFISVLVGPLVAAARNAGLVELSLAEPLWRLPVSLYRRTTASDSRMLTVFSELCVERAASFH